MKKIACIILHYRDLKNTNECLKSVLSMKKVSSFKVVPIVVDNASDESFVSENSEVIIIRNKVNKGFTGGMNTGIRYALNHDFDFVMIVNNDTEFSKTFMEEAEKVIGNSKNTGVFVPKIFFYPGTEYHYDRYQKEERGKVIWFAGGVIDWKNALASHKGVDEVDNGQFDDVTSMDFATGCCMIFPRKLLEHVGLFDERYYLYFEDIDLSLRIKKAEKDIIFMPNVHLWHKNAKSSGGPGSNLQDYYMTRNRLLIGMTYFPIRTKIALMRESIRMLFFGRQWQRIGVRDFMLRKFGRGSYRI